MRFRNKVKLSRVECFAEPLSFLSEASAKLRQSDEKTKDIIFELAYDNVIMYKFLWNCKFYCTSLKQYRTKDSYDKIQISREEGLFILQLASYIILWFP